MNPDELRALIAIGRESRHLEYKGSIPWTDASTKGKITKAILGMSHVKDGGTIIIGVARQSDGSYAAHGMQGGDGDTFDSDEVHRYTQEYADPDAEYDLSKIVIDGALFIVIEVREFREIPIICRKNGPDDLTKGTIYTRNNVPETIPVPGETEMREIIDMAVDKGVRRMLERMRDMGILQMVERPSTTDQEQFEQEIADLQNGA